MARWHPTLLELGRLVMGPDYPGPGGAFDAPIEVPVNALLLRGAGETVLVDAGSGVGDHFWPGAAGLDAALAAAGCAASDVTRVVLTHLDFDHSGGVLSGTWPDRLEPAFPRARVALLGEGLAWWRARGSDEPYNVGTRLLELLERWSLLDELLDGAEVAPGVRLAAAAGHRPGHACVVVEGELLHLADVVHHPDHVPHPTWDPAFDADPQQALATRLRWLAAAADAGLPAVHAHVAGTGRVVRDGEGFAWRPEPPAQRFSTPPADSHTEPTT